jgi:short-subunit dehydrogenase
MQYGKLADVRCKGRVLVEINNEIAAVVTGGASGLGEAVVRSLAARGRALLCSRMVKKLKA